MDFFIYLQWQHSSWLPCRWEWILGITIFFVNHFLFFLNQAIHISFVSTCQPCGWKCLFFFFPVSFLFFLNSVIQRSLQELEGCHLKNRMLSSAIYKGIQYLLLSRNIRVIRNLGNFCVRGLPHLSKRQKWSSLKKYLHKEETTKSSASAYCVMLQSSFVCFTTQFGYRTSVHCKHKQHGKG